MRELSVVAGVALSICLLSPASAQQPGSGSSEAKLATIDARQKEMVARGDIDGLTMLSSPDLKIDQQCNRRGVRQCPSHIRPEPKATHRHPM